MTFSANDRECLQASLSTITYEVRAIAASFEQTRAAMRDVVAHEMIEFCNADLTFHFADQLWDELSQDAVLGGDKWIDDGTGCIKISHADLYAALSKLRSAATAK